MAYICERVGATERKYFIIVVIGAYFPYCIMKEGQRKKPGTYIYIMLSKMAGGWAD